MVSKEPAFSQDQGVAPSLEEPPPACDARFAQPGSPYKPSGQLGFWWIATIPAVVAGAGAGILGGSFAGGLVFAGGTAAFPRRIKPLVLLTAICVGAIAIVTAACTRMGRVRSAGFVFVVGLAGGLTFATFGLCGLVAHGAGFSVENAGLSGFAARAWTLFSDWSVLNADFGAAVPNVATRVIILLFCGVAAAGAAGATVLIHGHFTEGNLFDEASGNWYRSPRDVATLDPASRPRERWRLSAWRPIVNAEELASCTEWIMLRLHEPPGSKAIESGDGDGVGASEAGLPLVSFVVAKATEKKTFSLRRFKRVAKRQVETSTEGGPFFVSHEELNALLSQVFERRDSGTTAT